MSRSRWSNLVLERTICDYIAGMTDRFAIEEHQKLFDVLLENLIVRSRLMSDQPYLTAEGAAKLKEELEHLKSVERTGVSPALA